MKSNIQKMYKESHGVHLLFSMLDIQYFVFRWSLFFALWYMLFIKFQLVRLAWLNSTVQCIVGIAALQITLDFLSSARCSLPACSFQPLVQTISYRVDRRATVIIMIMNWIARDGSYTASDTHTPIHAYAHSPKEMDVWCHSKSLLLVNAVLFHLLWKHRTTRRDENSTQLMYPFPSKVCVLCCIVLCWCLSHRNCIPNCNILWAFSTITDLYECV